MIFKENGLSQAKGYRLTPSLKIEASRVEEI